MNAPLELPPPPPVVGGSKGMSMRETVALLHRLMFDPIGMIEAFRAEYGEVFTVPIPFGLTPPFTFITTREGYSSVLNLPPEVGQNGPIIDRVPALAKWTPRSDPSAEHLQTLLLTGRRFIGARLRERPPRELQESVRRNLAPHLARWFGTVDMADELVTAMHDVSARVLLGDDLWEALGEDAPRLVRTIVNAVDAARAATALSPAARFMPEYRATKELSKRLLKLARGCDGAHPFVAGLRKLERDGRRFADEDVAWMMFFAIWNATLYTGTYGTWSLLDWLAHPDELANLNAAPNREDLLFGAALETMRMNPISWQLRSLASPVVVKADGHTYRVPTGHFLSVFSHGLNRDAEEYPAPLTWRPTRYQEGAPSPLLFGTGPFSCVAQRWVKLLLCTVHAAVFDTFECTLQAELPNRVSRVHLLYPNQPVFVRLKRRATAAR